MQGPCKDFPGARSSRGLRLHGGRRVFSRARVQLAYTHMLAFLNQLGTIKIQHSDHRLQDILLELSGHRRHILQEDNGRPLDPHVAHATAPADATSRVRSACPPNQLYACTCARGRRILCSADNTRPLIHACVRSLTHSFSLTHSHSLTYTHSLTFFAVAHMRKRSLNRYSFLIFLSGT